jgi:amidophosphoribosyltransferase
VRQKLNVIPQEFAGKNALIVDDSIVRGTTSRQIVQTARDAGARKVFFASAAPPVRFPNVYGIDMPSRRELVAHGRTEEDLCREIGADALIYQDLSDLIAAASEGNPAIEHFETSCFDGSYITGDVTPSMLAEIERKRPASRTQVAAPPPLDGPEHRAKRRRAGGDRPPWIFLPSRTAHHRHRSRLCSTRCAPD